MTCNGYGGGRDSGRYAAATAVIIVEQSAPVSPVEVTVDRPFAFLIRDMETGAILFLGRVIDPSA